MVNYVSENGKISIANEVFTNVASEAAMSCFGVKGMAMRSVMDGLVHLLRKESMGKGVKIYFFDDNTIGIELHIIVNYGVNIPAVCSSIINEVTYKVQEVTGVNVKRVNVFVDSILFD